MIRGLYTALSGMVSQQAKMDVITSNLANANTNGYKSDDLAISNFGDMLIESKEKLRNGSVASNILGSISLGSRIDETDTSFEQGTLQETGSQTDFGIEGRGFFTVMQDNGNGAGQKFYTRDGNFHADSKGQLVTDTGYFVLDSDGNKINVGGSKFTSDAAGNLNINGRNVKLGVVDFNSNLAAKDAYKNLQKIGDNLYSTTDNPQNVSGGVKQGSLEKSNVNVITEMVNMMSVMRSFETDQKVVQAMDETLGKAVNDVGTVR